MKTSKIKTISNREWADYWQRLYQSLYKEHKETQRILSEFRSILNEQLTNGTE